MSFYLAFETTGAAKIHLRTLEKCRAAGYRCGLLFLYLSSVELAIERVKLRVAQGGHNIPEKDIVRRYDNGLKMLFSHYINVVDTVEIYDNSLMKAHLIAEKCSSASDWKIYQTDIWSCIQETYHDNTI